MVPDFELWPCRTMARNSNIARPGRGFQGAMTAISIAPPETRATPAGVSRNLALDRARTFLTLVVLLHHAVIPYTHFGHTDPKSSIGFDAVVLATDSFFMAMFFFL